MNPEGAFVLAAIFAAPTAVACALAEAIVPRRRVPLWLTAIATIATAVMLALVLGVGGRGIFWFVIPPVSTLALRGLFPHQWTRLAVGTVISIAAVKLGAMLYARPDSFGILAGGATSCTVLWVATVLLLRAVRWTPSERGTDATGSMSALASVLPPADFTWPDFGPRLSAWFDASLSRRRGLGWWLGTALVLYLGIALVIGVGGLRGGLFVQNQVWAITEFFGIPNWELPATRLWWVFGLPWSLLVAGAAWGVAGVAGGFDPGRLRVVRLAAIVLGGLLLLWTAHIAWQIHTIWSAEEAAQGIH